MMALLPTASSLLVIALPPFLLQRFPGQTPWAKYAIALSADMLTPPAHRRR